VPGQPHEAYEVVLFRPDGGTEVYARH
jgi:hypothetical protein